VLLATVRSSDGQHASGVRGRKWRASRLDSAWTPTVRRRCTPGCAGATLRGRGRSSRSSRSLSHGRVWVRMSRNCRRWSRLRSSLIARLWRRNRQTRRLRSYPRPQAPTRATRRGPSGAAPAPTPPARGGRLAGQLVLAGPPGIPRIRRRARRAVPRLRYVPRPRDSGRPRHSERRHHLPRRRHLLRHARRPPSSRRHPNLPANSSSNAAERRATAAGRRSPCAYRCPSSASVAPFSRMSASCSSIQSPGSRAVTAFFKPRARRTRSSSLMVSAR
jgi:hypothetical protein